MSTNSIIAVRDGDGFKDGVYVHWNGSPPDRGPEILNLGKKLGGFAPLWEQLKGHSWSTLWYDNINLDVYQEERWTIVPEIGVRHNDLNPKDLLSFTTTSWHGGPTPFDEPWVYVLDPPTNTLSIFCGSGWNEGVPTPLLVGVVRMDQEVSREEWSRIECGEKFERCSHYAWAHFPDIPEESRRLDTWTWLGITPLTIEDAIAYSYYGRRLTRTGSGYLERLFLGGYGNRWIEELLTEDGARLPFHTKTRYKTVPEKLRKCFTPIFPPIQPDLEETA